jgi:hypothetical protein
MDKITPAPIMMGIPFGKRCNLWITFENTLENSTIMLLMQPNNNIIIQKYRIEKPNKASTNWQYGTLFFGTFIEDRKTFVIENIMKYKGIDVGNRVLIDRLAFILEFVETASVKGLIIKVAQIANSSSSFIYKTYTIKEIGGGGAGAGSGNSGLQTSKELSHKTKKYKPQYKLPTIFKIKARPDEEDIYELYAYGMDKRPIFYAIAGLNDFKMSTRLKTVFANSPKVIKNLDYIETSDDESEPIINTAQKGVFVECVFNDRFNKWFPVRIIGTKVERYVNILML